MATSEGSENNMEFFFTLDATPELQNTHTIFGKVTGDTIYNMLKLAESQTDANERPLYPHKINKIKILHNPFDDIQPRAEHMKSSKSEADERKKNRREGVKNFKLISFGDEAEQDEQEVEKFPKEKVSEAPAPSSSSSDKKEKEIAKSKPAKSESPTRTPPSKSLKQVADAVEDSDSDYEVTKEKEKLSELERKRKEIQDQIKDIKKQYQKDKKDKIREKAEEVKEVKPAQDTVIQDYLDEKEKYKKKKLPAKGASREDFTLSLLAKFKDRLHTAHETTDDDKPKELPNFQEEDDDENWLAHKLDFSESQNAVLAKDASKKEDDWYDIYDPRNPLNKRKRGAENASASGEPSRKK